MTLLRALLSDVPQGDRPQDWALFGTDGQRVREGRDVPAAWPRAERIEAVVAAARARVITLTLPPMPAERLDAAVAYALEDQLAATDDPPRIAHAAQQADGRVEAAVASRALIDALAQLSFAGIVPEAALVPDAPAWTLYASGDGEGFVRTPGDSFAVTLQGDGLPAELGAALAQARRAGAMPDVVHVAFSCDRATLARYADAAGVPFAPATPWRWSDAPVARVAAAPDWLAPSQRGGGPDRDARAAWFRPALAVATLALALHVGATLTQWLVYHWSAWRVGRDTVALARDAGIADATTPSAAVASLVRQHADARHRAGLSAPADALPLLAQATPALALLPPGTIRSAVYGDGAWTLDLAKVDAARMARVDRALAAQGVALLQAPTAAGLRVRLTATP